MKKVSIITRAYNRLEYTKKCIDSIIKNINYDNYEHIIINNNSTDGTTEWLNLIKNKNLDWYNKVKPINLDKNYGDWGSMLKSLEYVDDDSEYILQVNNDIEIKQADWLNKMIYVLENTEYTASTLSYGLITPENLNDLTFTTYIKKQVDFFMVKTQDFKKFIQIYH